MYHFNLKTSLHDFYHNLIGLWLQETTIYHTKHPQKTHSIWNLVCILLVILEKPKAALLLSYFSYRNPLNVCIFMCLLPEGPPKITCSPAPGLLFPATGPSCQSPPSLSLGCALSLFFTQLQRPHRGVPLPFTHQTCSNHPRDRGVQSGTTSAPSLRTSCTSQACSLSSPLFFFSFFYCSFHPHLSYNYL